MLFLNDPKGPPTSPANSVVIRGVTDRNAPSFQEDQVFLGRDGSMRVDTNVAACTPATGPDGPLRTRHGTVPASSLLKAEEHAATQRRTPMQAMDAAASAYGAQLSGYQALIASRESCPPGASHWWGRGHAWTWAALGTELDRLVVVPGPIGPRGLWVAGEFFSRLDLARVGMAVCETVVAKPQAAPLTALDLLKGTSAFFMHVDGGVDMIEDLTREVDEAQPAISCEITATTLSDAAADSVLSVARRDGFHGERVRHVTLVGSYADGLGLSVSATTWNLFAVTSDNGKVLTAYLASDPKLPVRPQLPTNQTDQVPSFFFKPTLAAIVDTLGPKPSFVSWSQYPRELTFFVKTVLKKGVPATTRQAFELEFAELPAGRVEEYRVGELARKYPGIANAWSPTQWNSLFRPRGLEARPFGALW